MLVNPLQPVRAGDGLPSPGAVEFAGLGNRFIGLLGRKWSRRSFAAEVAKLLANAARARAVAILAYERQGGHLVFLADFGLPGEARLALGGANQATWEIPLRGLQNRRITVIEAAHQNPNVPQTLTSFCPEKLCIVSLPIYYDGEPVGAVVLFAPRNRAFSDAQLQTLSQALRVCGRGLQAAEAAPARGGDPRRPPGTAGLVESPAAFSATPSTAESTSDSGSVSAVRLHLVENESAGVAAVQPVGNAVTDAQRIEQESGWAQAEMQRRSEALRRLISANRALKAERDYLVQQVAELEKLRAAEAAELRRQLSNVEDRLLAAESERLRLQRAAEEGRSAAEKAMQVLQAERAVARAQLEGLESGAAEASSQIATLRGERDGLGREREELTAQLQAAQAEATRLFQNIEQARQEVERHLGLATALRDDLAASQRAVDARGQLIADLRTQLEGGAAERQTLIEEQERLRQAMQRMTADQQRLESARAQWLVHEEARERLEARLSETAAERDQALEWRRQAETRQDAMRRQMDELGVQLGQREALAQAAIAEREQLAARLQAAETAAAAAARESAELRRAVNDAVERLEEERLSHASELQTLLEEFRPEAAQDAEASEPEFTEPESGAGEAAATAPIADALTIERSAPLTVAADALYEIADEVLPAVPQVPAVPLGELVLLDEGRLAEQACAALAAAGFDVTAHLPDETTIDELARRKLKCIMVNLGAGAAAWRTLRMLRQRHGTRHVPILAYAANAQAATGFCFGRVDFALWPLEPGRMIERLGRLRPKLQRLLLVSTDVEGMGRLREPLTRARISSSVVLDAKQALEFAAIVQPEAAVVHLSPACPSGARAVTGLRANEPTRALPLLILIDDVPAANEDAFLANITRHFLARSGFQFSHLPEEIGRLIG